MRTWFQRWLSAATAEESMLRLEWLPEVLMKADVMVALEAERSSSAPEDDVRWCTAGANGGHRVATADGGGGGQAL
jgi:hypothetical protein